MGVPFFQGSGETKGGSYCVFWGALPKWWFSFGFSFETTENGGGGVSSKKKDPPSQRCCFGFSVQPVRSVQMF